MVINPPKETNPPPVRPVPAVTVKEELVKLALAIDPEGRDNPLVTFKLEVLITVLAPKTFNDPPIPALPEVVRVEKSE